MFSTCPYSHSSQDEDPLALHYSSVIPVLGCLPPWDLGEKNNKGPGPVLLTLGPLFYRSPGNSNINFEKGCEVLLTITCHIKLAIRTYNKTSTKKSGITLSISCSVNLKFTFLKN